MTKDLAYSDDYLREILSRTRTIAQVGATQKSNRPAFAVMRYLQGQGYRVIPVNPAFVGEEILGERVYADLKSIAEPIDLVQVFRRSEFAGAVTDEAIAAGAKVVWMQLGVRDDAAAERAKAAGLKIVMDRCPKIELDRLAAESG